MNGSLNKGRVLAGGVVMDSGMIVPASYSGRVFALIIFFAVCLAGGYSSSAHSEQVFDCSGEASLDVAPVSAGDDIDFMFSCTSNSFVKNTQTVPSKLPDKNEDKLSPNTAVGRIKHRFGL